LENLNLQRNVLRGALPSGFTNLVKLVILNLSNNFFSAQLPEDMSVFSNLVELRINTNYASNVPTFGFSGTIPASIGSLTGLTILNLYENIITGTLPAEIGLLQNLQILDVAFTKLTGFVPGSYGALVSLEEFYITGTSIEGVIPDALCLIQDAYIQTECTVECECCAVCLDSAGTAPAKRNM
jgi:hypothetical protein